MSFGRLIILPLLCFLCACSQSFVAYSPKTCELIDPSVWKTDHPCNNKQFTAYGYITKRLTTINDPKSGYPGTDPYQQRFYFKTTRDFRGGKIYLGSWVALLGLKQEVRCEGRVELSGVLRIVELTGKDLSLAGVEVGGVRCLGGEI